ENLVFEKDYMLGGGYGTRIYKNIFLGFKAKYISSTLAEKYSASTYALDMDFLINTPTRYIFRIGVENFGGSIKYLSAKEYLPNFFIAEISKYFNFRDLFLSIGFGFRKSKDYSSTSIAGEFSVRKFPLRVLGGYKKGVNLSRYFTGLGLLIENVYLSCSFEFPSILGSNGMKISFTYFFTTPNIFPSDYNNKYDIKNNQKLKKDIHSNYIDKTKEKKFSPLHQKNENYDVIIF
ncbi:MAG: hypothetical protein N2446_04050, partial [Elusimicrobiales bacterium]|nr:hypothetical protein [Elusimicrobiales bacterium]